MSRDLKYVRRVIIAEEREVLYRCLDCKKLICETAYKLHLDNPSTAKHRLINLFTDKPTSEDEVPIFCPDHYRKFESFCVECNRLLCIQCLREDHKGHQTKTVEEAFQQKTKEIGKLTEKANEHAQEIQRKAEGLKLRENKIDEASELVKSQMEAYFQEVQNFLRLRHQALLSELAHRVTEKKSVLESQNQSLLKDVKRIQNVASEINQTISQEPQLHVLHLEKQLRTRLSTLKQTTELPTVSLDCGFASDATQTQKLSTSIHSLGSLRYDSPSGGSSSSSTSSSSATHRDTAASSSSDPHSELDSDLERRRSESDIVGLPDYLGSTEPQGDRPDEEDEEETEPKPREREREKPGKPERGSSESSINGGKDRSRKKKKQREDSEEDD